MVPTANDPLVFAELEALCGPDVDLYAIINTLDRTATVRDFIAAIGVRRPLVAEAAATVRALWTRPVSGDPAVTVFPS
jgi:hypothetical protein